MPNITLIEDNPQLRESLVEVLCAEGHEVSAFPSVEAYAAEGKGRNTDVFLLDLNLPGEDGISFAGRLRTEGDRVGIVMLTARSDLAQREQGYVSGADIYLTKPSSPVELIAAIDGLCRRLPLEAPRAPALVLDLRSMQLEGSNGAVSLSSDEVETIQVFLASPEGRASHMDIAGNRPDSRKGTLEVRMARLRRKFEQAGAAGNPFRSIRGWGYHLAEPVTVRR